jgi:hypothetical protein
MWLFFLTQICSTSLMGTNQPLSHAFGVNYSAPGSGSDRRNPAEFGRSDM